MGYGGVGNGARVLVVVGNKIMITVRDDMLNLAKKS